VPISPLASIAHISPVATSPDTQKIPDHAEIVADMMLKLPWYETYGLSYAETMQLDFAEWRRMVDKLFQHVQHKQEQDTEQAGSLSGITKHMVTLLLDMVRKQTKSRS
jgi:hypothetical protein